MTNNYITKILPLQIPGERIGVTVTERFLGWENNPNTAMSRALEQGGLSGLIDTLICDACAKESKCDFDVMTECPRCSIFLDLINGMWDLWEAKVRQRKINPELNRGASARARTCYEALIGGAEVWYSDAPTLCGCASGTKKKYVRTVEAGACGMCGALSVEDADATKEKKRLEANARKQKSREKQKQNMGGEKNG
jgi:hypothetical protein